MQQCVYQSLTDFNTDTAVKLYRHQNSEEEVCCNKTKYFDCGIHVINIVIKAMSLQRAFDVLHRTKPGTGQHLADTMNQLLILDPDLTV